MEHLKSRVEIGHGEDPVSLFNKTTGILVSSKPSAPFTLAYIKIAGADSFMAEGDYTTATGILDSIALRRDVSNHLKISVCLRLNKIRRRTRKLNMTAIGAGSAMKLAIKSLDDVEQPVKIETMTELVATLFHLKHQGHRSCIQGSSLILREWRIFSQDSDLIGNWRLEVLRGFLADDATGSHVPEPPPRGLTFRIASQTQAQGDELLVLREVHSWLDKWVLRILGLLREAGRTKRYELDHAATLIKSTYSKITCILIILRQWDHIGYFLERPELSDEALPFLDKPATFPGDGPDLWGAFYKEQ
ncbi:hypothetical protein DL770_010446 [Monosporascus sp. CRB-9-2]|nr:hypothetical protein DL770_010446 [Monosporascus sp. CRB-9-2]